MIVFKIYLLSEKKRVLVNGIEAVLLLKVPWSTIPVCVCTGPPNKITLSEAFLWKFSCLKDELNFKELNFGPKTLVASLQSFIQSILLDYGINSNLVDGAPGVYVEGNKIASIGLRVSRGKTYHGISLNVDMDLEPFTFINPCGYEDLKVVQIKDFNKNITIKDVEKLAIKKLENIF